MRSLIYWLASFCIVFVGLWFASAGWHQVACGQGIGEGMGWGLLALLFSPIASPIFGLTALVTLAVVPVMLARRLALPNGMWRGIGWALFGFGLAFAGSNVLARLVSAQARCSLGF